MSRNESSDHRIDEQLLVAYVDGELDTDSCERVESALARDAAMRERIRRLRESADTLRGAYQQHLYRPPDAILALLGDAVADDRPGRRARVKPGARRRTLRGPIAAVAASVAAFSFGWLLNGSGTLPPVNESRPELAATIARIETYPGFQNTLETTPSGMSAEWSLAGESNSAIHPTLTPIRSYRLVDGRYCREFLLDEGGRTHSGVACREGGSWEIRQIAHDSSQHGAI